MVEFPSNQEGKIRTRETLNHLISSHLRRLLPRPGPVLDLPRPATHLGRGLQGGLLLPAWRGRPPPAPDRRPGLLGGRPRPHRRPGGLLRHRTPHAHDRQKVDNVGHVRALSDRLDPADHHGAAGVGQSGLVLYWQVPHR